MSEIHPMAVVEKGAELGEGVRVGPFCYVAAGARIGDGCELAPRVTVYGGGRMGAGCRLHSGAVVADVPQDLSFDASLPTYVEIGDRCVLREGVTIHRATQEGASTRLGADCYLMANAHVAHDCAVGNGVILVNGSLLAGHCHVADCVIISGNAAVHQFVHIGRLAMVSGLAAVTRDIPPFCMLMNAETSKIAGLNVVGMRRAGIDAAGRRDVKEAFRILYRAGLNPQQAVEQIRAKLPEGSPGVELADFVAASKRGICQMG